MSGDFASETLATTIKRATGNTKRATGNTKRMKSIPKIAMLTLFACLLSIAPAQANNLPLNPAVTQETIGTTICIPGWSRSVRPSPWQTSPIKMRVLCAEGLPEEAVVSVQLDHRIPIALGGALLDERNFILQDWDEADDKDRVETCLARAVCAGRVALDEARHRIWEDWRRVGAGCGDAK